MPDTPPTNVPLWNETTHEAKAHPTGGASIEPNAAAPHGQAFRLAPLDARVDADVCVIGLGGSGLACVHELLSIGKRVVGIDAATVAAGAAGRNGGFLLGGLAMFHHDAVDRLGRVAATAIYEETLKQVARMAEETPAVVRRAGSLRIAVDDEELEDCERQFGAMQASGLPVERYRGAEGRGLLFPADAAFDPVGRCRMLAAAALTRGACLYERSRAVEIGAGVVATASGEIVAEHVVVAVDGGLERVLPELRGRVRSARLQMLGTAPAPASEVRWPRPVYARWGFDYWQQLRDGRVVLGGCRDVGGDAEWTTDSSPTDAEQSALTSLLRSRLGIHAEVTHRWAATVGYTQSGMPILEQVRPHVWAIGGYSGTGNVVGALCGRAVAELITRRASRLADLLRA
ncbi:MAG TPA: FAD-binding oxidoreductase [Casimicrobiaceae bacterium]